MSHAHVPLLLANANTFLLEVSSTLPFVERFVHCLSNGTCFLYAAVTPFDLLSLLSQLLQLYLLL